LLRIVARRLLCSDPFIHLLEKVLAHQLLEGLLVEESGRDFLVPVVANDQEIHGRYR